MRRRCFFASCERTRALKNKAFNVCACACVGTIRSSLMQQLMIMPSTNHIKDNEMQCMYRWNRNKRSTQKTLAAEYKEHTKQLNAQLDVMKTRWNCNKEKYSKQLDKMKNKMLELQQKQHAERLDVMKNEMSSKNDVAM
jgi:hypothetical protein